MKEFKLPALRVFELASVVDSLQPKDLVDIQSIRQACNIVKDLQESCKPYTERVIAFNLKRDELVKQFQEKFKGMEFKDDAEKAAADASINAEFMKAFEEQLGAEQKAIEAEGLAEVKVELADDKFKKLQEFFNRFAAERYIKKEPMLQVADALEV